MSQKNDVLKFSRSFAPTDLSKNTKSPKHDKTSIN